MAASSFAVGFVVCVLVWAEIFKLTFTIDGILGVIAAYGIYLIAKHETETAEKIRRKDIIDTLIMGCLYELEDTCLPLVVRRQTHLPHNVGGYLQQLQVYSFDAPAYVFASIAEAYRVFNAAKTSMINQDEAAQKIRQAIAAIKQYEGIPPVGKQK